MSRLSDLYKAMETLRKEGLSLNEDLERQVSELEDWRKRSMSTHSERSNPPTFEPENGLKTA